MARLNTRAPSPDTETDQNSTLTKTSGRHPPPPSPFPVDTSSSDKENRDRSTGPQPRGEKRKTTTTSSLTTSASTTTSLSKRRRIEEKSQMLPSQAAHRRELDERVDKQFYDPDQDEDERRATKKGLRDLGKELHDSRAEYLQPNSKGIETTLKKADKLFKSVKQTSTATIDSRLLVDVADLSYKKTNEITIGDSSTAIDVEDFLSKCISFMKQDATTANERAGPSSTASAVTQTQRQRRAQHYDDEDEDEGDALNWEYLGRNACFPSNSRPSLSGFLLGPLSVQKKVRQPTQRRAREARANYANAVRPLELLQEDVDKQESASLTVVCKEIAEVLGHAQQSGEKAVEEEIGGLEDPSDEDVRAALRRHRVSDNAQVLLFDFCVNPKSFGQTVENMFYVSFLIKEGKVGLDFDSQGMPTLGLVEERTVEERQETPKNQAIFTLDYDMWEAIVESHGIQQCIIPHRQEEQYDDGIIGDVDGGDVSD